MNQFRLERLNAALTREGLDAVLATSIENVHYVSGFFSICRKKIAPSVRIYSLFVKGEDDPWSIIPVSELPSAYEAGVNMEHTVAYGMFPFEYEGNDSICTALKEVIDRKVDTPFAALKIFADRFHLEEDSFAVDYSGLDGDALLQICGSLGYKSVRDGSSALLWARRVKDEKELSYLRKASEIADEAIVKTIKSLRAGMSEYDAEVIYQQEILKLGAETTFGVFTFGKRAAFVDTAGSADNLLQEGDMIRADVGCSIHGYNADMSRTGSLGKPREDVMKAFEIMRIGQLKALEKVRAGARFCDIYHAAMSAAHEAGLPNYKRVHCGHNLGLSISEPPGIRSDCEEYLDKDMVLCIETPYYVLNWGGVQVEDTIRVTETGYELFTKSSSTLIIV